MPSSAPYISVVSPFFDEAAVLRSFCDELRAVLDGLGLDYEVVLVDDGSTDGSSDIVRSLDWPQCTLLRLVKNVGHQDALDAGLQATRGAWVVTMDADLQHPPSLIPLMLEASRGAEVDIVYAVRPDRREESWFKRGTAALYYVGIRRLSGVPITPSTADFRLMSRRVVDIVNAVPERKVFRLLLPSLGFPSVEIPFLAAERAGGSSKYSLVKMTRLGLRSVVEFSSRPLHLASVAGLVFSGLSLLWLLYVVAQFLLGNTVEGWASTVVVVLLVGGLQLLTIGLLGTYVGRLYEMAKGRPHFVVAEVVRSESDDTDS